MGVDNLDFLFVRAGHFFPIFVLMSFSHERIQEPRIKKCSTCFKSFLSMVSKLQLMLLLSSSLLL